MWILFYNVYNRRAYLIDAEQNINLKHEFVTVSICFTNLRLYMHEMDIERATSLKMDLVESIRSMQKGSLVYRISQDTYGLILAEGDCQVNKESIEYEIRKQFENRWYKEKWDLSFNTVVQIANVPKDLKNIDEVREMVDYVPRADNIGMKVIKEEELGFIRNRIQYEQYMQDAIRDDSFEVYFQPIVNLEDEKVHEAEALLQLNVPGVGFIPPDNMIPLAEESGLISDIGEIVFRKVCEFIRDKRPENIGIYYIEVNLSLYQFLRPGLADRFAKIMYETGVQTSRINIELTETATTSMSEVFEKNVLDLRQMGFNFSLDDYGTGYSNLSNVVKNDFENIKLDKSLLWDAGKSEKADLVLKNTMEIVRKLDMNVVQEGVETKNQLEMVRKYGGNRIQGYYYSKPLPPDDFIAFTKEFNENAK